MSRCFFHNALILNLAMTSYFFSSHINTSLFPGSYSADWRDRELKMILGGGGVEGWEVVTRRAPGEWPELVSDLANAVIVRTGGNKRRSRH